MRRIQQFIDEGLIPPPIKEYKDKQFNNEHLLRYIATIKLKNEGYSLKQIQPIISSYKLEEIQVKILNKLWDSIIVEDSPYDPQNEQIRKDG